MAALAAVGNRGILIVSLIPFALILFIATLTNNLAGFGMALVAMPLLIGLLGIKTATPLISLVGLTLQLSMIWRYRRELNPRAVWRLSSTSIIGIPIGILSIDYLDEKLLTTILGIVVLFYVFYRLISRDQVRRIGKNWGYPIGFIGGLLGGAFNTSGPPVVLYADSQRWPPSAFRANLQTYFLFNGLIGLVTHTLYGNYTAEVGRYFLMSLPFLALGYAVGGLLDPLINPTRFRQGILILLVILGVRMATTWM